MDSLGSTGPVGLTHVSEISCRSARWLCNCRCFCHTSGASAGKTWLPFSASGLFSSSRLDWACFIPRDSRASWGLDFELACCRSYHFLLVKSSHKASPDSGNRHHLMMGRDEKSRYKGCGGKRAGDHPCLTELSLWKSGRECLLSVLSPFLTHFAVTSKIKQ